MAVWNTACPDWEHRIIAGRSLVPDLPLFEDQAAKAVRIFNRLRLPDVIGNPTFGEAVGDWLRDVVRALFGAYDQAANRRMIKEVFLLVPKKNNKSTGAAGIMLAAAIINERPHAELLFIAPTKEVADIAFRQAEGMVRVDPELNKLFHIQRHIRTITNRRTDAKLQIKAADTDTITGGKQTFTLLDETHVFSAHARAADVLVELRGALAARPDGFLLQITTQSKTPPAGVFRSELQKARDVRDGKRSLPLLPILYEYPDSILKEEGWRDPGMFGLVNPNLGRSVDMQFLVDELKNAEELGREQLALFASQHLNVEIGLSLRSDRWAGADHWLAATERGTADAPGIEDLGVMLSRCEVAVVGIDGGGLDDMLGLVVLGREKETRRWLFWARAWVHECVLERRKAIAPLLLDFVKEGTLWVIPDDSSDDIAQVGDIVEQVEEADLLPEKAAIGVDPAAISDIIDELEIRGFSADPEKGRIIGVRQGSMTLNNVIKTAERRLAKRDMVHGGTRLMAWVVGNAKVEAKGNAVVITKQAAGTAKIDPLMAGFNAVALMSRNPEAMGPSVYEDEEIFL